jgi:tetratricopeptide (TPR) repeat protein
MKFAHRFTAPLTLLAATLLLPAHGVEAAPSSALTKKVECIDQAKLNAGAGFEDYDYCFFRNDDRRLRLVAIDKQNIAVYDGSLSIDSALAILANPNAAALHKTLLREAGNGLEKLRVEELNALKDSAYRSEFNQNALVSLNPGSIGKLIDKSKAFSRLGYPDLAISMHEKLLATYDDKISKRKGKPLSLDDQWEWFSLRSSYLGVRMGRGEVDGALAGYQMLAKDERIYARYRTNAKVNLAAHYAELGRFDAALKMIDEAKREFDAGQEDFNNYKLTGSDRHFAWIKACALHGLGKTDDAKPFIAIVLSAPEKPVDQFADIYATSSIERRLYACMGDVERMAELISRGTPNALYGNSSSLILQPELVTAKPRYNAFLKKLREHPKMKATAEQFTPLSSALIPALNSWK